MWGQYALRLLTIFPAKYAIGVITAKWRNFPTGSLLPTRFQKGLWLSEDLFLPGLAFTLLIFLLAMRGQTYCVKCWTQGTKRFIHQRLLSVIGMRSRDVQTGGGIIMIPETRFGLW